jgi:hypothetical protein
MKQLLVILILLGTLISCDSTKTLRLDSKNVKEIEIYEGSSGTKIQMKEGFEKDFIIDLSNSVEQGPTKFIKTHRILVHYSDKKTDTIYTNGTTHNFNGWFESEVNLIEKYTDKQVKVIDTIAGRLMTAEKLKNLMAQNKHDEAILLFSKRIQKKIYDIKDNPEIFKSWYTAWTFDEESYEYYTNAIKEGKVLFVFEDNEWKIDEK